MPVWTPTTPVGGGFARPGAGVVVHWDEAKIRLISSTIPMAAHQVAALAAAQAAAEAIHSKASGRLAADVRVPKPVAPMSSLIGSGLVYAGIQNHGGVIRAKPGRRMLIHGPFRSAGGQYASREVVASAVEVTIPAKNYLLFAPPTYTITFISEYRRMFPR